MSDPLIPGGPAVGSVIAGRYRVDELIGRGGMGAVFRATQLGLGRAVALKVIRPDHAGSPTYRARFEREARVMAALDHPNAVKVFDFGTEPAFSWLAMELLVGQTLAGLLARGPLSEPAAARIGAAVADVLVTAHAMRLVHRDLKPENLFVLDGEGAPDQERVRVVDFGIAFIEDAGDMGRLTRHDIVVGTPAYISPEYVSRRIVGPPTDLYALGIILFEMVAGTPPFVGDAGQLQAKQIYLAPPTIGSVRGQAIDPRYEELVARLLRKDPDGRPLASEVRTLLREIASGPDSGAVDDLPRQPFELPSEAATGPMLPFDTAPSTLRVVATTPLGDDERVALSALGVTVVEAGGGADVDVVITPGVSAAVEVARAGHAGAAIVARLPAGEVATMAALIRAGADDVVMTPGEPATLARKVLRAARQRRTGASSTATTSTLVP